MRANTATSVVLFLILLGMSARSASGGVMNGDFENGLTGWTVNHGEWFPLETPIPPGNHIAFADISSTMYQDFVLPAGATTLEVDFGLIQSGQGGTSGPQDVLNLCLLDPLTSLSLIPLSSGEPQQPVVNYPYLGQSHDGFYDYNADYVSVTLGSGTDPDHVSVSLGHLPASMTVRVLFQMLETGDNRDSQGAIDNVVVLTPEPATAGFMIVFGALAAMRRRRLPLR